MPLSVVPALSNVQSQHLYILFPETPMGALFTQVSYDPPQEMTRLSYPPLQSSPNSLALAVPPQAIIPSSYNSSHLAQWSEVNGMYSSAVGPVQPSTTLPVIPQSLPPPFPTPIPAPSWIEVPQRAYKLGRRQPYLGRTEPISFSVNGLPGINMGDALRKHFVGLDDRDGQMFQNAPKAVYCRFLFPGYPVNRSAQIATLGWTKNRSRITRSKLAYEVAKKLKRYLDSMTGYPIDESIDNRWKIGEGFMRLENMVLVRLVPVSEGSFQPEIWVADTSM